MRKFKIVAALAIACGLVSGCVFAPGHDGGEHHWHHWHHWNG